jgi:hypothetical protein
MGAVALPAPTRKMRKRHEVQHGLGLPLLAQNKRISVKPDKSPDRFIGIHSSQARMKNLLRLGPHPAEEFRGLGIHVQFPISFLFIVLFDVFIFLLHALLSKDLGTDDAHLVENNQRPCHQELIHHIRRGGDDGCDHEAQQDGVFPVPAQKARGDDPEPGQHGHDQRKLKDKAEGNQKRGRKAQILSHGGEGLNKIRLKAQEVLERVGKHDRVPEENTS